MGCCLVFPMREKNMNWVASAQSGRCNNRTWVPPALLLRNNMNLLKKYFGRSQKANWSFWVIRQWNEQFTFSYHSSSHFFDYSRRERKKGSCSETKTSSCLQLSFDERGLYKGASCFLCFDWIFIFINKSLGPCSHVNDFWKSKPFSDVDSNVLIVYI